MAICEKCGEEFKPYWRLAEIQDKKCEKCEYVEDEGKNKRIWTALLKVVVGFLIIIINQTKSFPLEVVGILLIIFGLIKLFEDAIMHKRQKKGNLWSRSQKA